MWFKVFFFVDKPFISAAVGPDRQIYFKASDVGRFLGYSSAYSFARRYAKINLIHSIPRCVAEVQQQQKHVLVFTYEQMMEIIERKRRKDCLLDYEERIRDMNVLWSEGLVSCKTFSSSPAMKRFYAPVITLSKHVGSMRVGEWIEKYAAMVMEAFSNLQNFDKRRDAEDCIVSSPMSPFLLQQLQEPPSPWPETECLSPWVDSPCAEPMERESMEQEPDSHSVEPMERESTEQKTDSRSVEPMEQKTDSQSVEQMEQKPDPKCVESMERQPETPCIQPGSPSLPATQSEREEMDRGRKSVAEGGSPTKTKMNNLHIGQLVLTRPPENIFLHIDGIAHRYAKY